MRSFYFIIILSGVIFSQDILTLSTDTVEEANIYKYVWKENSAWCYPESVYLYNNSDTVITIDSFSADFGNAFEYIHFSFNISNTYSCYGFIYAESLPKGTEFDDYNLDKDDFNRDKMSIPAHDSLLWVDFFILSDDGPAYNNFPIMV